MLNVHLKQNAFGRWIIVPADQSSRGWYGSRFVDIDDQGFGILVQVSNFEKRKTAAMYAELEGFTVLEAVSANRTGQV